MTSRTACTPTVPRNPALTQRPHRCVKLTVGGFWEETLSQWKASSKSLSSHDSWLTPTHKLSSFPTHSMWWTPEKRPFHPSWSYVTHAHSHPISCISSFILNDLNTCLFLPLFQKWVPSDENGQPFPITGVIFLNCTYWKLIFLFWQLLIFQMWASTAPASELLMEPGSSSLKHASGESQRMTSSVFLGWLTDKALSWTEADH